MLFLCFRLGDDRYALDCGEVIEVLPLLGVKRIPQAPPAVAGAFNYRGEPTPVIDLSQLALGRQARRQMSTRIIVVRYPDAHATERPLGLIAERATETVRRDPAEFRDVGVASARAPYLGPVAADPAGLLQWIDVKSLLPSHVRDVLFRQALEHA